MSYYESLHYMTTKVIEAWGDSTHELCDVLHEELDLYCSHLYNNECDEIIASYGIGEALKKYDSEYGSCPKTSQQLLYVVMSDMIKEIIEKYIDMYKTSDCHEEWVTASVREVYKKW